MRAFFSVVIPVKNRKKELIRCLVSLSHQTFEDFEVVVIDDNSNDDYTKLIRYFKNLNIKLFKNEGVGANSARNLGASKAHSKYIAFLDSDDIFLPNKLSDIYDVICSSQTNICVSQLLVWRGSPRMQLRPLRGPQDKQDISEYFFVDDCRIQSSSFVIKKEMFEKVQWNEQLDKIQDPDFLIRLYKTTDKFIFIKKPLAVLYDVQSLDKISSNNHSDNMNQWLNSVENPLSSRAKYVFRGTVLSFEIAKSSILNAIKNVLKYNNQIPVRLLMKTIIRILLPEFIFKKIAQYNLTFQRKTSFPNEYHKILAFEEEAESISNSL